MKKVLTLIVTVLSMNAINAQDSKDPKATEVWEPVPKVVTPGTTTNDKPDDAIVLFDGKDLNEWVSTNDPAKPAGWTVSDGIITVKKGTGNIQTKRTFTDYQLHLEWRIPEVIHGKARRVATADYSVPRPALATKDTKYKFLMLTTIALIQTDKPERSTNNKFRL